MQIPVPHLTSTKSKYPEVNTGNPGTLLKFARLKFANQREIFIIKHNFDPTPNIYCKITFFSGEFATPSLFFSVTPIPALDSIFPTY